MSSQKHKVFISYYHADDQEYKDALLDANEEYDIFDDYSVHEDEIDDTDMTDEQIRREIRDNYIKNATVLLLLCGKNTKKRKHIDWEIHAAMYDSDENPKMGILVVNLPSLNQPMIASGNGEEQLMSPNSNWAPLDKEKSSLQTNYPYLPNRIITNLQRDSVHISVVNWDVIVNDYNKLVELIDNAFGNRKTNQYDHSEPLKGRNS